MKIELKSIEWVIFNHLNISNAFTKKATFLVAMSYEMDKAENYTVASRYKGIISGILDDCNLLELGDEERMLVKYYINCNHGNKLSDEVTDIYYDAEFQTFSSQYGNSVNWAFTLKLDRSSCVKIR